MWGFMIDDAWVIARDIEMNGVRYADAHLRGLSIEEREALGIFPVRELAWDAAAFRSTGFTYSVEAGELVGTPNLVAIPEEEITRANDSKRRADAIAELASLDGLMDRATEDLITLLDKWEDPALAYQKARRDRKAELRVIIAETAYLVPVS